MTIKRCPECGQAIDETPTIMKTAILSVLASLFIAIGFGIAHVRWV